MDHLFVRGRPSARRNRCSVDALPGICLPEPVNFSQERSATTHGKVLLLNSHAPMVAQLPMSLGLRQLRVTLDR